MARFEREAKTLAALNHPHIAHLYGLEESGGHLALVMELVDRSTLAQRLTGGSNPMDEVLAISRQLAQALEYAHERGIIHRDLKPANIALTNNGTVKVLDFGLARVFDSGPGGSDIADSPTVAALAMTSAGLILGTVAYMSPKKRVARRWTSELTFGPSAWCSSRCSRGGVASMVTRQPTCWLRSSDQIWIGARCQRTHRRFDSSGLSAFFSFREQLVDLLRQPRNHQAVVVT